jgi:hypothetical protein
MLAAALRLGVPPHLFWRLSLAEWRSLTTAPATTDQLSRAAFAALAERFPDMRR